MVRITDRPDMTSVVYHGHKVTKAMVLYFLFYQFFSQQVRVGGRNKNKNKIHSDHFRKPSILIQLENGPKIKFIRTIFGSLQFQFNWKMVRMNFIFILPIKMAISHQVLSLLVIYSTWLKAKHSKHMTVPKTSK